MSLLGRAPRPCRSPAGDENGPEVLGRVTMLNVCKLELNFATNRRAVAFAALCFNLFFHDIGLLSDCHLFIPVSFIVANLVRDMV